MLAYLTYLTPRWNAVCFNPLCCEIYKLDWGVPDVTPALCLVNSSHWTKLVTPVWPSTWEIWWTAGPIPIQDDKGNAGVLMHCLHDCYNQLSGCFLGNAGVPGLVEPGDPCLE